MILYSSLLRSLPISVVEDKAYCEHAFKNYRYKFSHKYVSKIMLCLTELVEAMIAKEINVTKKSSILYNDWTKHGIHYIATYACYYVFIKIRKRGKIKKVPEVVLSLLSCAPMPGLVAFDEEDE